MSKLEEFIKEYADNAGITLNEQDLAPPMGGGMPPVPPMGGGMGMGMGAPMPPASTVAGKLDAKEKSQEVLSADEIVEFTQNIKDALGIDPSNLSSAEKGDAFAEDITPENFNIVCKRLEEQNIEIEAQIDMSTKSTIEVSEQQANKIIKLLELLDDQEDVQKVHSNFDIK